MLAQQVEHAWGRHGVGAPVVRERHGTGRHRGGLHPVTVDAQHRAALFDALRHGCGAVAPCLRGVDLVGGPAFEKQGAEHHGEDEAQQQPVATRITGLRVPAPVRAAPHIAAEAARATADLVRLRAGPAAVTRAATTRAGGGEKSPVGVASTAISACASALDGTRLRSVANARWGGASVSNGRGLQGLLTPNRRVDISLIATYFLLFAVPTGLTHGGRVHSRFDPSMHGSSAESAGWA